MTELNWKRPLALAAGLLVLALGVYWLEFRHAPEQERKTEDEKKVFSLKESPVASVQLFDGARTYKLRCLDIELKLCRSGDNSKWQLEEPLKMRADDSNSNSLLSSLNNLSISETVDLSTDTPEKKAELLKTYGLSPEALASPQTRRIEVTDSKGAKTILYLGEPHPISESTFGLVARGLEGGVKAEDSRVLLVPNHLKTNFEHDLTHWRDKKLFTVASHEVANFELNSAKTHLTATRKDGKWLISSKKDRDAEFSGDIENIDNLLSAAVHLSAKTFAERFQLAGTKSVLTLKLQSSTPKSEPITLTIFEKTKGGTTVLTLATVSNLDPIFVLEPGARSRVDKSFKDLRLNKLVSSMDRFTTQRLEFSGLPIGTQSLVLSKVDDKWIHASDRSEADSKKIEALLEKLTGSRIRDFASGAAIPSGEANGLTLAMGEDSNTQKRHLVFWTAGARFFARDLLSQRKEAFEVDASLQGALPWKKDFFIKQATPAAPLKEGKTQAKNPSTSNGH